MPTGRCSGCGRTGSLCKIRLHVVACDEYIDLFARDPEAALDPHTDFVQHRRAQTAQARAIERGHRLEARFAEINRQQAASASRWVTPPDILD